MDVVLALDEPDILFCFPLALAGEGLLCLVMGMEVPEMPDVLRAAGLLSACMGF